MLKNKSVIIWLLSGCVLVFIMVVVGGITRLTNSGLSMTDWHLVTDTFPPMTETKWQEEFQAYKQFPEYQKINIHNDFTISDYKFIYFWEWFHRFIGRIIGLVFIIPFIYFLIKKRIDKATLSKCFVLLGMGALQGFFGWFMVKSGLVDNPDVSHFRLALHLTFAFLTFAYTLWVALDLIYPDKREVIIPLKKLAQLSLIFLIIQIIYGGFVAGLNAGLVHNHWPLMSDRQFFHDSIALEKENWLLRFTEGKSGLFFAYHFKWSARIFSVNPFSKIDVSCRACPCWGFGNSCTSCPNFHRLFFIIRKLEMDYATVISRCGYCHKFRIFCSSHRKAN